MLQPRARAHPDDETEREQAEHMQRVPFWPDPPERVDQRRVVRLDQKAHGGPFFQGHICQDRASGREDIGKPEQRQDSHKRPQPGDSPAAIGLNEDVQGEEEDGDQRSEAGVQDLGVEAGP
jgi:hypothetical protein